MSSESLTPRGNALTHVMEVAGPDEVPWVAYIDGLPPARARRLLPQTVLPGRRLRFDSAVESRVSPLLPAGSPFLPERRLLELLGGSSLLPPVEPPPPSRALLWRRHWRARIAQVRGLWTRGSRAAADLVHQAVEALLATRAGAILKTRLG